MIDFKTFDPFAGIVEGLRGDTKAKNAMEQLAGTQLGGQAMQRLANQGGLERQGLANTGQLNVAQLQQPANDATASANLLKAGAVPKLPDSFNPTDIATPRRYSPSETVGAQSALLGKDTSQSQRKENLTTDLQGNPIGGLKTVTQTQTDTSQQKVPGGKNPQEVNAAVLAIIKKHPGIAAQVSDVVGVRGDAVFIMKADGTPGTISLSALTGAK